MFKEISPNEPSQAIPINPEKLGKRSKKENKAEKLFHEKTSEFFESSKIGKLKDKFLKKLDSFQIDDSMDTTSIMASVADQKDLLLNQIKFLPEELQNDPEFINKVIKAIQKNAEFLLQTKTNKIWGKKLYNYIIIHINNHENFIIKNLHILKETIIRCKSDTQFESILKSLNPLLIEDLKKDEEFLLNRLEFMDSQYFFHASDELINLFPTTREFIFKAFAVNPIMYRNIIPKDILDNPENLKDYLLKYKPQKMAEILFCCQSFVESSIINDSDIMEFIVSEITNNYAYSLDEYDQVLQLINIKKLNENQILSLAKISPFFLKFLPKKMQRDSNFIIETISKSINPLMYCRYFDLDEINFEIDENVIFNSLKISSKFLYIIPFKEYIEDEDLQIKITKEILPFNIYLMIFYSLEFDKELVFNILSTLTESEINSLYEQLGSINDNIERLSNYKVVMGLHSANKYIKTIRSMIMEIKFHRKISSFKDFYYQ